jgi:hypothetical protein
LSIILLSLFPTYHETKVLFDLTMFDASSARAVWQARSALDLVLGKQLEELSLDSLATAIVLQLKNDGVLPECPERWPALSMQGCKRLRAKAIEDIKKLPDLRERMEATRQLPVCRDDR